MGLWRAGRVGFDRVPWPVSRVPCPPLQQVLDYVGRKGKDRAYTGNSGCSPQGRVIALLFDTNALDGALRLPDSSFLPAVLYLDII